MTVSSETNKSGPYTGNGVTTVFAYGFRILDATHLRVVRTQAGAETTISPSAYTVSGVGSPGGGNVTFTVAPVSGATITILRDVPFVQETDLENQGAFFAEVVEDAFDAAAMRDQQLKEEVMRSLRLPISVGSGVIGELPVPVANKVIGWNNDATALQNLDASDFATIVAFGTVNADTFTGDGVTVDFALTDNPGALANLDVSVNGVTLVPVVDYTWSAGTTLTFTVAPAVADEILVRYMRGLPQGSTEADLVLTDQGPNLQILLDLKHRPVADLLTNTTLTYGNVTAGLEFEAGGFRYQVAPIIVVNQHLTTAGGVKLYALPAEDGSFNFTQFGGQPVASFDNGPALRVARAASEAAGSAFAAAPIVFDFGTYEVRSAETDTSAGVRFQKAPTLIGKGKLSTLFHWYTSVANQPLFEVDPSVATACWGIQMRDFAIWARVGAAAGGGIKVEMTSPSATFGSTIDGVRVVGCYDGITTSNVSGTTVYGCVVKNCSVEQVISGGKGFNIGGSYLEMDNCEGYPSFDGTGETAYAFYLTAGWSKFRNIRAAGPIYADAPYSDIDFTIEGQASTCAHNGNAAARINRMKKIRAAFVGARITAETNPRYGLSLQDSGYLIEDLSNQDASGYSSPITPLQLATGGARISTLLLAQAGGSGVLKPESDIEVGFDPTFAGRLKIINGGTYTDYGKWSFTYDPPSIGAGANTSTTVTCPGLRDLTVPVSAALSTAEAGIAITATVVSATQVEVRLFNYSGGAIDMASGTLTVRAHQPQ